MAFASGDLHLSGSTAGANRGVARLPGGAGGSGGKRGDQAEPAIAARGRAKAGSAARPAGGVQRGNRLSGSGGATGSSGTAASGTICGKGLQLRGRTQQRGADATKPAPQDDARVAGPQKAVLEPADISHGQTPEDKSLPAAGSYPTVQPLLVAVAPTHTRSATRTIVRPSWCHLRKSRAALPRSASSR